MVGGMEGWRERLSKTYTYIPRHPHKHIPAPQLFLEFDLHESHRIQILCRAVASAGAAV